MNKSGMWGAVAVWIISVSAVAILGFPYSQVSAADSPVTEIKKNLSVLYLVSTDGEAVMVIACRPNSEVIVGLLGGGGYPSDTVNSTSIATFDTASVVAKIVFGIVSESMGYASPDDTFLDILSDGVISVHVGSYQKYFSGINFKDSIDTVVRSCYF